MLRNTLRLAVCLALLTSLSALASAQDEKPAPKGEPPPRLEDYREFFKTPENARDFWKALQFEIEVGRFDLAARLLRAMLDKRPDDKELLELEQKEGMSAFLRLRNLRQWSKDPKRNAQALKDVEELIGRMTTAVKEHVSNPERIARFTRNLHGDPEERAYALQELYRSGAAAVPFLVDALRRTEGAERLTLLAALGKLGRDTVPPLLAALDIDDSELRVELIDVFQRKAETDAVPHLWYLSASPKQPERVRRRATEALAYLTSTLAGKLPPARAALTREAERYYRHQVTFPDPGAVTIWRWDGKRLVPGWPKVPTVPATKAEEYFGLRFAGQALDLDPAYEPAQIVFLSLALEKGVEQSGLEQPLAWGAPAVNELVATVHPELVTAVLDRALTEQRLPVILGAVRALGALSDVRGARATGQGSSALVRALNYPERRVQLAAAEALLRIPGQQPSLAAARIIEVLRRALAINPAPKALPKVLVGYADDDLGDKVGAAVAQAGFEPVRVRTGRDLLRRLNEAADIDAVLIDPSMGDPGLSSLLAQLRADIHVGRLPLLVAVLREREESLRRLAEPYKNVWVVPADLALDAEALRKTLGAAFDGAGSPPLSPEERMGQTQASLFWLARLARGEVPGYDLRPAAETLLGVLRSGRLADQALFDAIVAVARLPGREPQVELAAIVQEAKKPGRLPLHRIVAAELLARHIQQHGVLLPPAQVRALHELYQTETEPGLRTPLAVVLGSMRPDARLTGERLKSYTPQPLAPEPPAKEPPPDKEGPPKEKENL